MPGRRSWAGQPLVGSLRPITSDQDVSGYSVICKQTIR